MYYARRPVEPPLCTRSRVRLFSRGARVTEFYVNDNAGPSSVQVYEFALSVTLSSSDRVRFRATRGDGKNIRRSLTFDAQTRDIARVSTTVLTSRDQDITGSVKPYGPKY